MQLSRTTRGLQLDKGLHSRPLYWCALFEKIRIRDAFVQCKKYNVSSKSHEPNLYGRF